MGNSDKRWIIQDRDGNNVYLTEERWAHIIDSLNHSEMAEYEECLKTAIQKGRRRQEPLNPRKYRYVHPYDNLPNGMNHVVAIVLFGFDVNEKGETVPNNFVATAFFKHIILKGSSRA